MFRLVRAEPSEAMERAHFEAHAKAGGVFAGVPEIWSAMLAASEAPTDAEIDELCRAMWPDKYLWRQPPMQGAMADHDRNDDRTRMRAFIAALEGPPK